MRGKVLSALILILERRNMTPNSTALRRRKTFTNDMHKLAVSVMFTQMIAKKGINRYVDRVVAAMYK